MTETTHGGRGGIVDRWLPSWDRLAPLSVGAVASGALFVAARSLAGRVLRPGVLRLLGWPAAIALGAVALWLWSSSEDERTS